MARLMTMRPLACAAVTMLLSAPGSLAAAQTASPAVVVEIVPAQGGPTIDPNIFGQFAEHLGTGIYGGVWVGPDSPIPNVRGIRSDVVQAVEVPLYRDRQVFCPA